MDPEAQAEPDEAAIPARSSPSRIASASARSNTMLAVLRSRAVRSPVTAQSGTRRATPSSSRSRGRPHNANPGPGVTRPAAPPCRSQRCPARLGAGTGVRAPACRRGSAGETHALPRNIKRADAFGPCSLCADSDSISMPAACTSSETRPAACTASVWNSAPALCASAASSAMGKRCPSRCSPT